jgi:GTP cyclohydrolase IA
VTRAVVAIGSNIEPERNVAAALAGLGSSTALRVLATSGLYRAKAVGGRHPDFLNAAVLVDTDLDPTALRVELRAIENALGRVRVADRNAPRTIDLDVILFEGFTGTVDGTVIPDPDLGHYGHIAVPAADVAPSWEWGPDGRTLKDIAEDFSVEDIRPLMTEPNDQQRYATEQRMEAIRGEVYRPEFEATVVRMLELLGEDPERTGLARTPLRVAKAMDFLTSGYGVGLEDVVNDAIFESDAEEMVIVKDVEFYSLCEHHMLPFFGKAHVAYMPNGRIIGLSKVARIVDHFARRLQVQERLTNEIADAMEQILVPHGVAVVMSGSHFCMMMRGVQKQGSSMVTSAMRGGFKDNPSSRAEFMGLIRE